MKVLDIYGKKDLDILTCRGIIISKIMNDFFSDFPIIYRENYDRNISNVEIWRVDEHYDGPTGGEYSDLHNLILLRKNDAIIHELMHLSSFDCVSKRSAFIKSIDEPLFEDALVEGMTEYLTSVALDKKPDVYLFETFNVSMLPNINEIFEHYFIPNYDKFIGLFPNKRDIISLMYSLDYYSKKTELVVGDTSKFDDEILMERIEHSINDVIDTLIDIQLSMKMGKKENRLYSEKFMDLIGEVKLREYLEEFNLNYLDYANEQINKRVLRRLK